MNKIKNIVLTLIVIMMANISYAQSCMMLSSEKISGIECSDNNVAEVHLITTLNKESNTIVITPLNDGEALMRVKLKKNKTYKYKIKVSCGKVSVKGNKRIKSLDIDLPPEFSQSEGDIK